MNYFVSQWRSDILAKIARPLSVVWNSKENYISQLGLDLEIIIQECLEQYKNFWSVTILDIWWNSSTAIIDLKSLLVESWVPEWKIFLTKIDLNNFPQDWVNFLEWDLENDEFLSWLWMQIWFNSQSIIFMNQVSQYLWDKLKVIKFVSEHLLRKWGRFYFNLVSSTFYTWNNPFTIFEDSLNSIISDESSWFKVDIIWKSSYSSDLRLYCIIKISDENNLEFPEFVKVMSVREIDWLRLSWYNFRKRMSLEKIEQLIDAVKVQLDLLLKNNS